ncbi:hypothetical protein EYF80_061794 [Liparis tanakae]|uniref:Uncharacterized protein n=1 Tax=Liparis tanakae TaxID=230148 RepID=A0A4Z2EGQ2_9TELE|nr:hypothetical protein EYF80_061794 [Liparis tanakae]
MRHVGGKQKGGELSASGVSCTSWQRLHERKKKTKKEEGEEEGEAAAVEMSDAQSTVEAKKATEMKRVALLSSGESSPLPPGSGWKRKITRDYKRLSGGDGGSAAAAAAAAAARSLFSP